MPNPVGFEGNEKVDNFAKVAMDTLSTEKTH